MCDKCDDMNNTLDGNNDQPDVRVEAKPLADEPQLETKVGLRYDQIPKQPLSKSAEMQMAPGEQISKKILSRFREQQIKFFANDTIHEYIQPHELELLQAEVENRCQDLLSALLIDTNNDHNTHDTAKRMAKMFLHEVMKGRYHAPPRTTAFPNAKHLDEIYTVGPISIRSMCSHHMVPIIGQLWIGVLPSDKGVFGLSKFNRLADWVFSRPQIQEEAVIQLAEELESKLKPMGVAIVIKADHMCMHWRGVKDCSSMVNSVMRGVFKANNGAREEFLQLIKGQGYE